MAASRRYYPGFFGALFLVLLRIAIGWHFLYEGTQKILSTPWGKASILGRALPNPDGPQFSSEGYLRNASGPLAPRFRELGDVEGRDKLDLAKLKAHWATELDKFDKRYVLNGDQKKQADDLLKATQATATAWFLLPDNRDRVTKYLHDLDEADAVDKNPDAMSYQKENAKAQRRAAEGDRKDLVKEVAGWSASFHEGLAKLPDAEQVKKAGAYKPPLEKLQMIDLATMWGLTAIGLCLMLGLFTPIAALAGAGYLLSFYLSMPPWPGLPEGITEGHYLFVNKNLIEMLACLVLASTPNGLWIGLDAFLFGWIGRGRRDRSEREAEPRPTERPSPQQDPRKYKSR